MPSTLVSIFCFCKNSVDQIRFCIDSILNQSYPYIEIVVQDGASTDGTLEALRSYGDRISLVSEPDRSPHDAFFKALRRCRGDIIGSCQSDEKLLPHAVEFAVKQLENLPRHGGIYGDTLIAEAGKPLWRKNGSENFSVEAYLANEVHFEFCSLFVRRDAYEAIGLHTRHWREGVAEFELVSRLGLQFPLKHISEILSVYTVSPDGLSQQWGNAKSLAENLERFLEELCAEPSCPVGIKTSKDHIRCCLALRAAHVIMLQNPQAAEPFIAKAGAGNPDPVLYFRLRRQFRRKMGRRPKCAFWVPWKNLALRACKKKFNALSRRLAKVNLRSH